MTGRLLLGALVGLGIVLVLVAKLGVAAVLSAVAAIGGWGFAAFTLYWLGVIALLGLAWFVSAPGAGLARLGVFVRARLLREAAADVLPLSQIGGLILGPRAVIASGAPEVLVLASTLVDLAAEIVAQAVYTVVGLTLFALQLRRDGANGVLAAALGGLMVLAVAIAAMLSGQAVLVRGLGRLARRWRPDAPERADAVIAAVSATYADRARVALAVLLHFAAWIAGGGASWLALRFMGAPAPFSAVIMLESLMYAARNLGFALPGGLGVQEAAFALLGPLCGVPAEQALALSFLRRARDVAIGVPTLAVWHLRETRAWWRRRSLRA